MFGDSGHFGALRTWQRNALGRQIESTECWERCLWHHLRSKQQVSGESWEHAREGAPAAADHPLLAVLHGDAQQSRWGAFWLRFDSRASLGKLCFTLWLLCCWLRGLRLCCCCCWKCFRVLFYSLWVAYFCYKGNFVKILCPLHEIW